MGQESYRNEGKQNRTFPKEDSHLTSLSCFLRFLEKKLLYFILKPIDLS